jgi:hypothetical protein
MHSEASTSSTKASEDWWTGARAWLGMQGKRKSPCQVTEID